MHNRILPSLLAANPLRLADEIETLVKLGITRIHLDIMDNHYVPNLTFGPHIAQRIREDFKDILIDVHLMTQPVDELIVSFAKAGVNQISIHPEATLHLDRSLALIQSFGCKAGLALNPATAFEPYLWCLHRLDFLLAMTVNPGFGGQTLIAEVIPKITHLKRLYPHLTLSVDGGINAQNIASLAKAQADQFVIGSALFHQQNLSDNLNDMLHALKTI